MTKNFSNPNKPNQTLKILARKQFYKFLLKRYCNGSKTMIDVGCGNNFAFIESAKELGYKAKGLEIDERFKSEDVEIGDIFMATGKCDVVFSNHVIEKFTSEQQEAFIKKLTEISDELVITIAYILEDASLIIGLWVAGLIGLTTFSTFRKLEVEDGR